MGYCLEFTHCCNILLRVLFFILFIYYLNNISALNMIFKCHIVIYVTVVAFLIDAFLWRSELISSWMMDEFICWPKPYLLLSATCFEILSWMIENVDEKSLGK